MLSSPKLMPRLREDEVEVLNGVFNLLGMSGDGDLESVVLIGGDGYLGDLAG